MTRPTPGRRALIIGGSLAGLFAGNLLRRIGWQVSIHERSPHALDSRGGGIVLQPQVVEVLRRSGVDLHDSQLGVRADWRIVLRPDGTVQSRQHMPQTQTSWSLLYGVLREAFGDAPYHAGSALRDVTPLDGGVRARFGDGTVAEAELLIGADGGNSTVRQQFWPAVQPRYAGYLAWRGLIREDAMPALAREVLHGRFGFANNLGSHILGYLVPGEGHDVRPGHRLYNWVWYRLMDADTLARVMTDRDGHARGHAVPEGLLADRWKAHIDDEAAALLPPAFAEVVQATRQPFAQAIRDLAMPEMMTGRVILIGDAAAIPRPHTAASTSKAAANALALARTLSATPDVDAALARWEAPQVALGETLLRQGALIGEQLMHRRVAATAR